MVRQEVMHRDDIDPVGIVIEFELHREARALSDSSEQEKTAARR
jgi:hypothetical protein